MKARRIGAVFATTTLAALAAAALDPAPAVAAVGTELVSVSSGGAQGDADSFVNVPSQVASDDGRYIVFESLATNLVAGDTNNDFDVFLRDRQAGTTERISVSSAGVGGNGASLISSISGNGRYVVFESAADNLVAGDTNNAFDVFLRDRQAGTTQRVSLTAGGAQSSGGSTLATVSDDGSRVAFIGEADDLVAGDTNGIEDVFVRDRQAGTTVRVSVSSAGAQADAPSALPVISGGGGYVSFTSTADNLVAGDTNFLSDTFVHSVQTATTERVSVATGGGEGSGDSNSRSSITDDGRYVAFESSSPDLVGSDTNGVLDSFVRDRQAGTTERVSVSSGGVQGNSDSSAGSISGDGRYVAFPSGASNLVASDTNGTNDIFVRDRQSGVTERVSVSSAGAEANNYSDPAFITADGQHVVFDSAASNLVASDTNGVPDLFVRDLGADACTITGTGGNDVLTGTSGNDVICGLGGNDTISALAGNDTIYGGPGSDTIDGGNSTDTINGGDGTDVLRGGNGDDTVDGGPGNDDLGGQSGNDTLIDHDGIDTTFGDAGNDNIDVHDGAGGDTATGGAGTDTCATDTGDTVTSC